MMKLAAALILSGVLAGAQTEPERPKLKTREEVLNPPRVTPSGKPIWIVPAGTRIPIQLRQPISTKGAAPGNAIYAQTAFPIVIRGDMVIPAGTWVQGVVDHVTRAGRIKGTAELQFHLTTLIYPNGYTLDIAAAIDQVPGDQGTHMKEPGMIKHDAEKGKDLEKIGTAASQGGQIGALAGAAASPSIRGLGVGGVAGIAAGTLIGLLSRGTDVRFETGTSIEIVLNQSMAIDAEKVRQIK
ncbi:MAG: hypothetical protein ABI823_20840 [Bryobacteraceae bacterium]